MATNQTQTCICGITAPQVCHPITDDVHVTSDELNAPRGLGVTFVFFGPGGVDIVDVSIEFVDPVMMLADAMSGTRARSHEDRGHAHSAPARLGWPSSPQPITAMPGAF